MSAPGLFPFAVVGGAEGEFFQNELYLAINKAMRAWGSRTHITTVVLDGCEFGLFAPEDKPWNIYILVFSGEYIHGTSPQAIEIAAAQLLRETADYAESSST